MIFNHTLLSLIFLVFIQFSYAQNDSLSIWDEINLELKNLPKDIKNQTDGYKKNIGKSASAERKNLDTTLVSQSKVTFSSYRTGYVVLNNGDTIKGRLKAKNSDDYNYYIAFDDIDIIRNMYNQQWKVRFKDEQKKKKKYRPEDLRAWAFTDHNGVTYKYVSMTNDLHIIGPIFRSSSKIFLLQLIDGPLEVYIYEPLFYLGARYNPQVGIGSTEHLCMKKQNEKLFNIKYGYEYNHYKRFKKYMTEYLVDCPVVTSKIASGEYEPIHLRILVDEYNKIKTEER